MADFPNSVYTPRVKENKSGVVFDVDKKTTLFAEDVSKLDDEVVAIESELGANPKGTYGNVLERLDDIDTRILNAGRRVATLPNDSYLYPTPGNADTFIVTEINTATTFVNPGGDCPDGTEFSVRISGGAGGAALSFDGGYSARFMAFPTDAIEGKFMILRFKWNAQYSTWDLIFVLNEL